MAKREARRALKKRKGLPKSKRFDLSPVAAKSKGINSGVLRAKQLTREDSLSLEDAN